MPCPKDPSQCCQYGSGIDAFLNSVTICTYPYNHTYSFIKIPRCKNVAAHQDPQIQLSIDLHQSRFMPNEGPLVGLKCCHIFQYLLSCDLINDQTRGSCTLDYKWLSAKMVAAEHPHMESSEKVFTGLNILCSMKIKRTYKTQKVKEFKGW